MLRLTAAVRLVALLRLRGGLCGGRGKEVPWLGQKKVGLGTRGFVAVPLPLWLWCVWWTLMGPDG